MQATRGLAAFHAGDVDHDTMAYITIAPYRRFGALSTAKSVGNAALAKGNYVVAIWAKDESLVHTISRSFEDQTSLGYLGCLVSVHGTSSEEEFHTYTPKTFKLSQNVTIQDGKISGGTDTYGLAASPTADAPASDRSPDKEIHDSPPPEAVRVLEPIRQKVTRTSLWSRLFRRGSAFPNVIACVHCGSSISDRKKNVPIGYDGTIYARCENCPKGSTADEWKRIKSYPQSQLERAKMGKYSG
jgi:hypothetical protein